MLYDEPAHVQSSKVPLSVAGAGLPSHTRLLGPTVVCSLIVFKIIFGGSDGRLPAVAELLSFSFHRDLRLVTLTFKLDPDKSKSS